MSITLIPASERRVDDQPATISIVRARIIKWKHTGNACGCENKIVQLDDSPQRRSYWCLRAKCGRCHQTVRLYQIRGNQRWTIDSSGF